MCRNITGGIGGIGVSTEFLFFLFSLLVRILSLAKSDDDLNGDSLFSVALVNETATTLSVGLGDEGKRIPFCRWLSSTKRRRLSRWVWAMKGNGDLSIGGSHRPKKMPTSLSIGGSLRRVTTASLAAEANQKGNVEALICLCFNLSSLHVLDFSS